MLGFIEALGNWGIPISILVALAFAFILTQLTGEILELCGKVVPTFFKVRKHFKNKQDEKKAKERQYAENSQLLKDIKEQQTRVEALLAESAKRAEQTEALNIKNCQIIEEFNSHYCHEKLAQRDKWMLEVNSTMHWAKERAVVYDASVNALKDLTDVVKQQSEVVQKQSEALELNNKMTSELYKQSTRTQILDFSHRLVNARKAEKPIIFSREEFKKIRKSYEAYEKFLATFGGTNGEVDDAMNIVRDAEAGKLPNIEFLEDLRD